MSKTTLDLSTLSDIADGAHTVKVKAKADGYIDSEFSNEVSYTKTSAQYITFSLTSTRGSDNDRTYSYSTYVQMTTNDGVKTGSAYYDQLMINRVDVDKPFTITALSTVKLYTQYPGDWIGYYINDVIHEQRGGDVNNPIEITLNNGDELKIIYYLGVDG